MLRHVLLLLSVALLLCSCATVRPYQRVYLNDEQMKPGKAMIEKFDDNVHTYREGASGGGTGKASGGCGCN
ncbi:DUF4266 domain-containing protein [Chitinophaga pendula]|uniref:DUF4266 domain-containing protein n=1 Tax=Chitinophaga TaxID=79328 RepID=UPI000BAEF157|nr:MULTISPECIES: DUF4266 domain-containing protein [Chitinophaga]ASZ11265.1 hypothetical protein CK934_09950 [Chitinophaga sp. MD30]UCJ05735.1 DUF4266 domain-containing protein [Chitinophaga pendula]